MIDSEADYVAYSRWWDVYFFAIATANAVALVGSGQSTGRELIAVAAIVGMMILHATIGWRAVRGPESPLSIAVLAGQVALFLVAASTVPMASWLLFAVVPLTFQLAPVRLAIGAVLLVTLAPTMVGVITGEGDAKRDLMIAVISAASGIWLGLWIIRVIRQSKERAALIAELEATRAQLARLSHEAGVTAERTRLAGEIHDTLAQGFTSIITLIQASDPELRDERLALAVRTAKENLAESRAIIAALSPSALASGLLDSVRRQASRFTEETGVPAGCRVTGEPRDLPTPAEVVLLRATQEALTNVRRHAHANEVAVLLAYAPGSVRIAVRDDGRGFDPAGPGGFGLRGMRQRAEQVGGTLTVRSDPDTGTTIELEVPA
jgi:signal transduction histidine kinase